MEKLLGIQDYILAPLLFVIILLGGSTYAKNKYNSTVLYRHFMLGLILKMSGSLLVGLIFMFYYEKGDTFYYFIRSKYLTYIFTQNPTNNWKIFFPELFYDQIINIPNFPMEYLRKANAFMVIRIAGFLNLFLFDSYFSVSLVFASFSFLGSWKLYKVFYYYYPSLTKEIGLSTLFLPGMVIWGGGLSKDTIALGSLGILIYSFHAIFERKVFKPSYIIYIAISIYMIGVVKPYILMALLPSLVFFRVNSMSSSISSPFLRTTLFPFVLLVVAIGSFAVLSLLNTTFTQYNLDNMEDKLEGFQRWHTIRTEQTEGAGYSLGGSTSTSLTSMALKFPLAVNVTLFRPYLWEARKPIVFLAALESLFVLFVTLRTFRHIGVKGLFKLFFSNPFISFCFVFAIIFSFAIGVSSYNFGALVRFKIQSMPFYMMALYMSQQNYIDEKNKYSKIIK